MNRKTPLLCFKAPLPVKICVWRCFCSFVTVACHGSSPQEGRTLVTLPSTRQIWQTLFLFRQYHIRWQDYQTKINGMSSIGQRPAWTFVWYLISGKVAWGFPYVKLFLLFTRLQSLFEKFVFWLLNLRHMS